MKDLCKSNIFNIFKNYETDLLRIAMQNGKYPQVTNTSILQRPKMAVSYTQTNGKGTIYVYEVGVQHCKKPACFSERKQWLALTERNEMKFQ